MAPTILSSPFVVETVLPFLLVFTIVFAVLQKSEILGKGKRQIDALVSLVIGLIVVSFGYASGIIVSIIPFLAVAAVIILIFMMLYGMTFKSGEFKMDRGIQIAVAILVAIGLIVVVLVATGGWHYISDMLNTSENSSAVVSNLIFLAIIILAAVFFMFSGKGKKE